MKTPHLKSIITYSFIGLFLLVFLIQNSDASRRYIYLDSKGIVHTYVPYYDEKGNIVYAPKPEPVKEVEKKTDKELDIPKYSVSTRNLKSRSHSFAKGVIISTNPSSCGSPLGYFNYGSDEKKLVNASEKIRLPILSRIQDVIMEGPFTDDIIFYQAVLEYTDGSCKGIYTGNVRSFELKEKEASVSDNEIADEEDSSADDETEVKEKTPVVKNKNHKKPSLKIPTLKKEKISLQATERKIYNDTIYSKINIEIPKSFTYKKNNIVIESSKGVQILPQSQNTFKKDQEKFVRSIKKNDSNYIINAYKKNVIDIIPENEEYLITASVIDSVSKKVIDVQKISLSREFGEVKKIEEQIKDANTVKKETRKSDSQNTLQSVIALTLLFVGTIGLVFHLRHKQMRKEETSINTKD